MATNTLYEQHLQNMRKMMFDLADVLDKAKNPRVYDSSARCNAIPEFVDF